MKLIGIELEHWQSFRNSHKIAISPGAIQITGKNLDNEGAESNRSGKTSILNAIAYCLYGRTPLVAKSKGLINDLEDWASVCVKFDGFSIRRYLKHPENGNNILADGNIITQEELDRLLGIGFDAFVATVFFGTSYSDFLEKILRKPIEAKELLTSLLPNLQIFDQAWVWVKKEMEECERLLNENNLEEANLSGRKSVLESTDYSCKINDYEASRNRHLEECLAAMKMLQMKLSCHENLDVKKFNQEVDDNRKATDKCNQELSDIKREQSGLSIKMNNIKDILQKNKIQLDSIEKNICPTCKRLWKSADAKRECLDSAHQNEKLIGGYIEKIQDCGTNREKIQIRLNALLDKDKSIRARRSVIEEIVSGRAKLTALENTYTKIKEDINPYIEEQKRAKGEIKQIELKQERCQKVKERLQDLMQYYHFWHKGFGSRGIKNFAFDEIVYRLTESSKKYLDFMTNGTIEIRFDPRKQKKSGGFTENIALEISSRGRIREDYFTWSQSERKKICLAVDLAMNQILNEMFSSPFEFIVFDETFDGLDRIGIELFCQLMRNELKRIPLQLVVSHSPFGENLFDSTLTIIKENGCSRVEQDFVSPISKQSRSRLRRV